MLTPMTRRRFRYLRQRLGWSQKRLAARLGVSRRSVIAWENGERPLPRMAQNMMDLLHGEHLRATGDSAV